MRKLFNKYWLFLLSFCFSLSFVFYYQTSFNKNYALSVDSVQEAFYAKEQQLTDFIQEKSTLLQTKGLDYVLNLPKDESFYLHIYRNDSLISWNTNQLPILRFADIHYPSSGLVKLQNGWYYAALIKQGKVQLAASFPIKKDYVYENEFLTTDFNPVFELPFNASVILEKDNAYPVYNLKRKFVFAIYPQQNPQLSDFESNVLLILLLLGIGFFLYGIFNLTLSNSNRIKIGVSVLILLIHYCCIRFDAYSFLKGTTFYNPALYASSNWFPNLLIFCLNCLVLFYFISVFSLILRNLKASKFSIILSSLTYLLSFVLVSFIGYLYHSLVKDSSIPLEIDKLFRLNYYSFWATLCMGLLFFTYFTLLRSIFTNLMHSGLKKNTLIPLWLISGSLFFALDFLYGSQTIYLAAWPLIIHGIMVLNAIRASGKYSFNYGVVLLFLFSIYVSININAFFDQKEKSERELFANQLASDQDISTELEFQSISSQLESDNYFQKIMSSPRKIGVSECKDYLERKFFNNFWERYEFDFFLFDQNNVSIINYNNQQNSSIEYLENILQKHSKISEIDSQVFYIKDYTSQLSYITKQTIYNADSSNFIQLYATLKTKRIPEKIGYPRLLISDQANVFKAIENYSIAKYYNGTLVSQNGKFSYPTRDVALTKNVERASGYYNNEGYNHYLFRKNSRDLIVLSKKLPSNFQLLTSFSYLFCFFGLFLMIPLVVQKSKSFESSRLTLAFKIQLILISTVVVALLAFGFGSGKFVSNQYLEYSDELVKEKIKSVAIEVNNKFGEEDQLSIEEQGEYMEFLLQKFASVFVTDINLYDQQGYLLASSRPKIFNSGLISDQINPEAFEQLTVYKKSEFIHQEQIGNLNFLSAYVPLFNGDGKFLAYINLQHFGQQQGFENQIENFLVAIINVFILLLAFSIILSILVSNWVTSPLKILQQSLARVQIGKYNKPILYDSNDEIGALVKNYNQKLEELAFTAQQLAQSERESAWREMAKQVAHEIKNPLTPMKLSLQHLQRIYDPNDPNSKQKLDRVVHSLVEQIDALTKIANEFSNFAKMPQENKTHIDILPIIEGTVFVFGRENDVDIALESSAEEVLVLADKDLIIRVFNNLIQNAIQAIPEETQGQIAIQIAEEEGKYLISIQDNGKGISEALKPKIFVPNFTTKSTGTGLGLAMVKQIVELHGGQIWFETAEGEGTTFFITLPKGVLSDEY